MKTANITTKETDLEVFYGMFTRSVSREPRDAALTSLKYLYSDLTDIRKYYIRLGFHLEEFSRCEYYSDFGFLTLEEFCDKNLGLDKSAVSRCINVYRAFNASNSSVYKNGIMSKGAAIELGEQWKDYSYTQLCEMLPLTPDQRKDISPDMSVKQIREYKKRLKLQNSSFASTQPEEPGLESVASTQLKKYDFAEYMKKSGIVEQNYIKSCSPLKNTIYVDVFDNRGRKILFGQLGGILYQSDMRLVIRMYDSFAPASCIPVSVNSQPDQNGNHNE